MQQIKLNVEQELSKMSKQIEAVTKDKWPEILAEATNEAGYYALNKIKKEMPNIFDRPKPYTINSMFLKKATARNLDATIQWRKPEKKSSGGQYLRPQVYGTDRPQKGFERELQSRGLIPQGYYAMPSDNIKTDQYGNVPASFFRKILIAIGAASKGIQTAQAKKLIKSKGILGAFKAAGQPTKTRNTGVDIIVVSKEGPGLSPGIYEKRKFAFGSAIKSLFSFIPKIEYKPIFRFEEIADQAVKAKFESKIEEAILKRIDTK